MDLKNLKLGVASVLETKATAILDTGTSMIVGPYADVGYLADMIGAWCVALVGADSSSVIEVRENILNLEYRTLDYPGMYYCCTSFYCVRTYVDSFSVNPSHFGPFMGFVLKGGAVSVRGEGWSFSLVIHRSGEPRCTCYGRWLTKASALFLAYNVCTSYVSYLA